MAYMNGLVVRPESPLLDIAICSQSKLSTVQVAKNPRYKRLLMNKNGTGTNGRHKGKSSNKRSSPSKAKKAPQEKTPLLCQYESSQSSLQLSDSRSPDSIVAETANGRASSVIDSYNFMYPSTTEALRNLSYGKGNLTCNNSSNFAAEETYRPVSSRMTSSPRLLAWPQSKMPASADSQKRGAQKDYR